MSNKSNENKKILSVIRFLMNLQNNCQGILIQDKMFSKEERSRAYAVGLNLFTIQNKICEILLEDKKWTKN